MAEQQAVDVLASAAHLETGYGLVGDLYRGKTDDALSRAVQQAAMFGTFATVHGAHPDVGRKPLEAMAEISADYKKKGLSQEAVGTMLDNANARINDVLTKHPDLPVAEMRDHLHDLLNSPMGDYAKAVMDGFEAMEKLPPPERPPEAGTEPPEGPAPRPPGPESGP